MNKMKLLIVKLKLNSETASLLLQENSETFSILYSKVCPVLKINYACVNLCEIFQHDISLLQVCLKFN